MKPAGGEVGRRRPAWKTILVAGLLHVIPFLGSGVAAVYVYTHNDPDAFHPGAAIMAGVGALASLLVLIGIALGAIMVVGALPELSKAVLEWGRQAGRIY